MEEMRSSQTRLVMIAGRQAQAVGVGLRVEQDPRQRRGLLRVIPEGRRVHLLTKNSPLDLFADICRV